ncbi:MAG TPA: hypothetical protein DGF66_07560 [Lachnoclostridium sp.]|nr:hypothetical protein [Lachnoclostridium sp.]
MHEINKRTAGTLPAVQPDLEYIPVCSDPRGIYLPSMLKEGAILKEIHIRIERQNTLYNMMEKMMCVLGSVSSLGMMYVLARLVIGA